MHVKLDNKLNSVLTSAMRKCKSQDEADKVVSEFCESYNLLKDDVVVNIECYQAYNRLPETIEE